MVRLYFPSFFFDVNWSKVVFLVLNSFRQNKTKVLFLGKMGVQSSTTKVVLVPSCLGGKFYFLVPVRPGCGQAKFLALFP